MERSTRETIIDKAGELFLQQGYNATTMRDIAVACGISTGNVNYHFKLKQDILLEIQAKVYRTLAEQAMLYFPCPDDPMESFLTTQATSSMVSFETEASMNLASCVASLPAARQARFDACRDSFYTCFRHGVPGFDKQEINLAIAVLCGSLGQFTVLYLSAPHDYEYAAMIRVALRAFLGLLRYDEERIEQIIGRAMANAKCLYAQVHEQHPYLGDRILPD